MLVSTLLRCSMQDLLPLKMDKVTLVTYSLSYELPIVKFNSSKLLFNSKEVVKLVPCFLLGILVRLWYIQFATVALAYAMAIAIQAL